MMSAVRSTPSGLRVSDLENSKLVPTRKMRDLVYIIETCLGGLSGPLPAHTDTAPLWHEHEVGMLFTSRYWQTSSDQTSSPQGSLQRPC